VTDPEERAVVGAAYRRNRDEAEGTVGLVTDRFEAGWRAAREYSKQREEDLREGLRTAIRLLDADSFDRVEIEPLRALAENGDSDE
jgi:hypothetical protein